MANRTKAIFYGFNPPFIGGQQNYLSRQEDDRLIKNDILQLLLTNPGERVMRPSYGIGLRNLVFESFGTNDLSNLSSKIGQSIAANDPRVNVLSVDIVENKDENLLNIKIVFNIVKDPKRVLVIEQNISRLQ